MSRIFWRNIDSKIFIGWGRKRKGWGIGFREDFPDTTESYPVGLIHPRGLATGLSGSAP